MLADRGGNVTALVAESKDAIGRKGVDWAAGDSDARYRLLADNLSDVIWTMDTNLKYTYISPSVTRLRGYSVEEAMALSMEETVTPASLETAMRVMAEAEAKQQSGPDGWPTSVTLEMELTCKDGSTVWVENRVTYLRDAEGRLTGYLGVSRDIGERRKAQAALVENEKRYRLLVENAGEGILVMQDGRVKYANRKTLDIFEGLGHAEQQVMSQPFTDFVHPEDRQTFVENSAKCLAGEEHDRSCLFRAIGNGSEIRWLQLNGVHLEWEGEPGGLVFLTDVTERKRVEEALKTSEERFRTLIENASDAVAILDDKGTILYESPSAKDIFGHEPEQLTGVSFPDLVHPEDIERVVSVFASVMESPGKIVDCQLRVKHKDGSWREVEGTAQNSLYDPKIKGIVVNYRDITERRKVEEALRESEERLKILFECAPDAYCLSTPDGTIIDANRPALDLTGYSREESIGKTYIEMGVISLEQLGAANAETLRRPDEPLELVLTRKDGRKVVAETKTFPVEIKGKALLLSIARDITERRKVEEALRLSEERYRNLVENTNDLIYTTDAKGIITYMGPQITRYGFTPEETVSRSFFGFVAPEDQERLALEYVRTIETGQQFPSEFRMVGRDGNRHWLEDFGKPLRDGSGNVIGVSGVLRDVTDRKKAQEALREQEDKYSTLVNQAGDAIGIIQDGKWAYVNPTGAKMFGYAMEEVAGKPFTDVISPASLDSVVQSYRTRLTGTEGLAPYEVMAQRKDGTPLAVEVSGAPIQYHGRPAVMAIARDITERKKAEQAVRESEARYRLLAENSSDVIWTMDANLRYTYMSPSVTSLRGYSVEEAMALSMEETTTPTSLQTAMRIMAEAEAKEGKGPEGQPSSVTLELELTCKDGSTVWVENRITYLRDAQGRLTGYQGVSRNITERKKAEEAIGESEARYRLLAENSSDVITVMDMNMRSVYMSPSITRLLGYSVEEALANGMEEGLTPASLKSAAEALGEVMAEEQKGNRQKPAAMDLEFRRKDGSTVWVATSVNFIRNSDGQPVEIVSNLHDITERKKAEETLKESEERLKILFDYAPDLYCLSTPEGIVVDANRFALGLFGYRREEIVGKSFIESGVISLDQFEGGTASTTQKPGDALQMVLNRKDGTKVTVEVKTIPVTIKGQSMMLSIARDITERKKAEEELRASDKRFKTLFESSRDATMLLAPERGFLKGNPAAVEMFGCKDEAEFTAKTPADLSPEYQPDGRPSMAKAQEMIATAMEKGSHFFEWTHKRVDGREFFADVLLARMEWEGKTVLQATVRDVSERKKTEEALKASEEFYSKIMENVEVAICIIGVDGKVVYQSAAGERLWGPVSETGGAIGFDIMHPDDLPRVMVSFAELLEGKQPVMTSECRIKHKDGTYHWCSTTATNCLDNPVVKGLVMVTTDINERKKAEEIIAESEKRYRLLAENASDVITVVGLDFKPKYMSPSTTRLLGYTVEEAMANGMENGLTPASLQVAAQAFAKALTTEQKGHMQKPMAIDLEFKRKDGSTVWVATSVSFIRDSEGKPIEILSNLHDITERKQAEEEMEKAKEIAEAANRAKSDFLASMSHEIRTPMNGVVGMTGLLADTPLNPEQRDYVESIRSSAEALMTIINDILDFSKVEAGKLNLEKMDFDLRSTMENMSDVLAVRAREKGLEYVWLLEPNVPTRLVGDPGRLRQILINLLGNAVKFTPKGNVDLRISLVSESDTEAVVQFDVRDTGIGIPSDKIGSLFKPFTQVDTSTTRKYGGTGLGLSISKRLVELMGGQLGVESREGMGSTFWFTAHLGKQSGERKSQELPLGMSGLRVLGVDDNPTNRKVLEHMLQGWGCRVELVENAAMAMARLHAAVVSGDPFRVAIVDIMMPEVDGETLGRMVKATPQLKDTVLIASSSSGGRSDAARLGTVGFAHYLTKPVKQSQLFNAIASCVAREGENTTAATCSATAVVAPSGTAVAETSQEQQKARILLAEDNAVNQKVAIAVLRKMGYSHVDVAASGAEAIKALEKTNYDLVLMDVHMPEMDGLEATRRIRDAKSTVRNHLVPVVAMTASAMKGDREMCLDAGMNDYISKPINRAELARALEQWAVPQPAEGKSPSEAEASPADRVFDRPSLLERVGGDEEICAEILKSFVEDVPERIKEMENSLVQGDNETLKRGAHTVKGAAGNVSAPMLQEAAGRLEAAVAAGELGPAREMLDAIAAEFGKFKKAIGQS